ncbi:hypothetical protein EIP91_002792 [Steccherinum ochraceum]|uniref:sphinganine-1-phosphate aldolase n=1 Tax=Steccherinum ochraceum TaxID=92696 RepID=A0A4R0RF53_9APHY|nr:hypothetical protein EIP91_002792 [Steccherinum ochraceum]
MDSVRTLAIRAKGRVATAASAYDTLKTVVFLYLLLTQARKVHRHLRARGVVATTKDIWQWAARQAILLALRLPSNRKKVDSELGKARLEIEGKLVAQGPNVTRHVSLPATGQTPEWILEEMTKMDAEAGGTDGWKQGKVSGAVYHGGDDLTKVIIDAFARYTVSNPLHPDVFPAIRKMDAEVVAMCLRMYNNPNGAGTTTSGGTESILLSIRAHSAWARATKGITEPEMVVPASAHVTFWKGAEYFGIKIHAIPVNSTTRKADLKRMERAINSNTIMVVGSAINFPDGCQDDIVGLGRLAKKYKIGLHVDCCLGSFIMPFLEKAGFKTEPFDFRVDGVTAISCDTHKYGFAPKGNSVIMYRNPELREYQYYVQTGWAGGLYASPTIAGSRAGSIIAGTWAALHYMGTDGYLASCKAIVGAAKDIQAKIKAEIPELYILGNPPASVVAFASKHPAVNPLEVGDLMAKRGWHLNALADPPAVHIAVTRLTVPNVDAFIADLKDSIRDAKQNPSGKGTMVALYGLGQSSAIGPTMVGKVATAFLDTLYKA